MSVPKNIIQKNYTSGNEFVVELSNKPYTGPYYELAGKFYVGEEYDINALTLIKTEDANTLLNNDDTFIFSFNSGLTSRKLATPELTNNPKGISGATFYCKQINVSPTSIKEIDQKTYESLQGNPFYKISFVGTYRKLTQDQATADRQLEGGLNQLGSSIPTPDNDDPDVTTEEEEKLLESILTGSLPEVKVQPQYFFTSEFNAPTVTLINPPSNPLVFSPTIPTISNFPVNAYPSKPTPTRQPPKMGTWEKLDETLSQIFKQQYKEGKPSGQGNPPSPDIWKQYGKLGKSGMNPNIKQTWSSWGGGITTESTAWCASFVSWVLLSCGFKTVQEQIPNNSDVWNGRSRSYKLFGTDVGFNPSNWRLWDVVVWQHQESNGGGFQGHVGFLKGFTILSGNEPNYTVKAPLYTRIAPNVMIESFGGNQNSTVKSSVYPGQPSDPSYSSNLRLLAIRRGNWIPPEGLSSVPSVFNIKTKAERTRNE
jgi:hypothetical protein